MKIHFASSVVFAVLAAYMALAAELMHRMILLVFVLIFFYLTVFLLVIELDKSAMRSWKRKERRLIEETYERVYRELKLKG